MNNTDIKIDELRIQRENVNKDGILLTQHLDGLITALGYVENALVGTTYTDIYSTVEYTKKQVESIKSISYGCISASSEYLLKKITEYELAALTANENLKNAIDALIGIWDNIDKTTWADASSLY